MHCLFKLSDNSCTQTENEIINQPNLVAQIPGLAMFDCKIHTRYEDIAY